MTNEIITTLHPDNDPDTNLYPNIKGDNIPDKSVDMSKLSDDVNSLLNSINGLKPSGVDTSTNILAFTTDKGIYVGSDDNKWYYWDGTHYIEGGLYITNNIDRGLGVDIDNNGYINVIDYKDIIDLISLDQWRTGSITSSGGVINNVSYRICNNTNITITNDIIVSIKGGFRFFVSYYINGSWDHNTDFGNNFKISGGSIVRFTIARITENTSETADEEYFSSMLKYKYDVTPPTNYISGNGIDITDNIISINNYSDLNNFIINNKWRRGSVTSSSGFINPISYRVCNDEIIPISKKTYLKSKSGWLFSVAYYTTSGTYSDITSFVNEITLDQGSLIKLTIKRYNDNTSELADIDLFISNILYAFETLENKVINVIGDSYVANNTQPIRNTWHYKYAFNNKLIYNNYGINGNPLVEPTKDGNPVVSRYDAMGEADIIIVIGGKNDFNKQYPIVDFKSGLRTLCEGLINKYIGKRIMFFTPFRASMDTLIECDPNLSTYTIPLIDYVNAIVDVCKEYNIPVFDTKDSQIYLSNSTFRSTYMQGNNDVSHLNNSGHDYFLEIASKFVDNNI